MDCTTGRRGGLRAIAIAAMAGLALAAGAASAGEGRQLPPPAADETPAAGATEAVAVLAGGCFWGVQGVFQHTDGVLSAVSGYAGGARETAHYERVGTGRTGHAEAVRITYDPRRISYGKLLQIFFSVAHDPTQRDRQGPDLGPQYRSAIFPESAEQARIARAYIAQLDGARAFPAPIVTTLEADRPFFDAEPYHQDFMVRHPSHPYIVYNDKPKVADLRRFFAELYRDKPVTVAAGARATVH